ncbi:uncharacterized protein LOC136085352 [Hydra vulgaris]|uniref:Uncharacterized protein LOC136085352 n=1 Tax=Hydra vulgaris TaxID=6087 RepID=A0ABM4CLQ8_HYDVU
MLKNINSKEKAETPSFLKDVVLNLCETEIPENHRNLLELGPKFVPTIQNIPYLDIISVTESTALKLEYSNKIESSQDLRRNVLRQLKMLKPQKNKLQTKLKNSSTSVKTAKLWNISNDEIQVSYGVVNLYLSIPLGEATKILLDMLEHFPNLNKLTKLSVSEIKSLIELCLYKCYFLWNEEIHELVDSGPIGLSLMVVLAEGFLQFFENKAIDIALHSNPPLVIKSFFRYVNDSHARFTNKNNAIRFQQILNSQHHAIKYTIELEDENKILIFLDIQITNNRKGNYDFNIHRKKAITNIQVKPNSNHDPKILEGIFKGFIHRALSICSEKFLNKEINFLINVFAENGYEKKKLQNLANIVIKKRHSNNEIILSNNEATMPTISLPWIPILLPKLRKIFRKAGYGAVFKSSANLKSLLTSRNKTKLPSNSHPGVYLIECECNKNDNCNKNKTTPKKCF